MPFIIHMPGRTHVIYLLYSLNFSFRTFNSTIIRRIGLFQGKHFSCECIRCKDPTEMSSYASAVLCSCGGIVIAEDPLDLTREAVWKCQECGLTIPALQVKGCLHIFLFNFNILFKKISDCQPGKRCCLRPKQHSERWHQRTWRFSFQKQKDSSSKSFCHDGGR